MSIEYQHAINGVKAMARKDGRLPLNTRELKTLRKRLGLSQDKLAEACFDQGFTLSMLASCKEKDEKEWMAVTFVR